MFFVVVVVAIIYYEMSCAPRKKVSLTNCRFQIEQKKGVRIGCAFFWIRLYLAINNDALEIVQ